MRFMVKDSGVLRTEDSEITLHSSYLPALLVRGTLLVLDLSLSENFSNGQAKE